MGRKRGSQFDLYVLWALEESDEPVTGKNLYEKLKKWMKERIPSLTTVYRVLAKLSDEEYVKKVSSERVRGVVKDYWKITDNGKEYSKYLSRLQKLESAKDIMFIPPAIVCGKKCDPTSPICFDTMEECWENALHSLEDMFQEMYGPEIKLEPKHIDKVRQFIKYPGAILQMGLEYPIWKEIEEEWEEKGYNRVWDYLKEEFLPHVFLSLECLEAIEKGATTPQDIGKYIEKKYDLIPLPNMVIGALEAFCAAGVLYDDNGKLYFTESYWKQKGIDPARRILNELRKKPLTYSEMIQLLEDEGIPINRSYLNGILTGLLTSGIIEEKNGRFCHHQNK